MEFSCVGLSTGKMLLRNESRPHAASERLVGLALDGHWQILFFREALGGSGLGFRV